MSTRRDRGLGIAIVVALMVGLLVGCAPSTSPTPAAVVSPPTARNPSIAASPSTPMPASAPSGSGPTVSSGSAYSTVSCDILPSPGVARPASLIRSCGRLQVPENRAVPGSRLITLPVVVVASLDPNPLPDPVVIVSHGGGGDTVLPALDNWRIGALRKHRDVVLVDGRGAGLSEPSLDCWEMDDVAVKNLTLAREAALANQVAALDKCRRRITAAGADLAGYRTPAIAADLAQLRTALGYPSWNLYGVSYGTREELELMREHPEGIRSVILDSTVPPEVDAAAGWGVNAAAAIQRLFDGCAADQECAKDHPHLGRTFGRLVAQLDAHPQGIDFHDPWADEDRHGSATGGTLIFAVFDQLYSTDAIGDLPRRIDALAGGDPGLLQDELAFEANAFGSEGAYYSVFCPDSFDWTDSATVRAAAAKAVSPRIAETFAWWSSRVDRSCAAFDATERIPAVDHEPVVSDLPTLILSGSYDPITPAAWGTEAKATLPHGSQVVFPGVGHGVLGTSFCADGVVEGFLADPTKPPDTSCVATMTGPAFAP